jgi:murein DD-endopeptidase MepM/ murein hydrolase activator NlpD
MRVRVLIVAAAIPLLLWAALPMPGQGAAAPQQRLDRLESQIDRTRDRIGRKKGAEGVLTSEIASWSRRIARLEGSIGRLGRRQAVLEVDLGEKRAELERVQGALRSERARLVRLRARLTETRRALAQRLVEIYQAHKPDVLTVVLNSEGFAELLERTEFIRRVSDQDRRIVLLVRRAKADATRTEARLDRLEARQQAVTQAVAARRDEVVAVKRELVGTRIGLQRTRAGKRDALLRVRADRHELEEDLQAMQASSDAIRSQLQRAQAASSGGSAPAGPVRQGSGGFVWPVNGPVTGVFGESRPGHMHAGIDIAVPIGTPVRASAAGRVALASAQSGYGNILCVQHSGSVSTCYAHLSGFSASVGASVGKGAVIASSGNTGRSTGPHVHYEVRVNGSPVDPMGYL